jgi:hypothetical protein
MNTRTPATQLESVSNKIKAHWKKSGKKESLKSFVRNSTDDDVVLMRDDWFHNKMANFSNAPLKIGSTRKKKLKNNQKPTA